MLTGLYSAATAMDAATRQHEIVARNLAHAQMPGYRRVAIRHASLESSFDEAIRGAVTRQALGTDAQGLSVDFTQGPLEETGHPLDVALQGNGFFVVQGSSGPLYTRNGTFHLDGDGRLLTADQLPVHGTNGEITISAEVAASQIRIGEDGTIFANGQPAGQLKIVDFQSPQLLEQAGVTLFRAPQGVEPHESTATVLQGMRERSNVTPIQELVELINAQRRHEAAQRSMNLLSESVQQHIDVQGAA